jgi:hypothetical protein
MSERRKERYSSVDLAFRTEVEQQINKALDEKTKMNFTDHTLGEVVQFLKVTHHIPASLHMRELEELDIGSDLQITYSADGISLRAALTDMLSEHELAFIIENEQLKITTAEYVGTKRVPRVYPVGDLVIPIRNYPGGGMMGGMMGGMGGGMRGGMGGGMMGGMGGGMRGGMGGMGGFMNVPGDMLPNGAFQQLPEPVRNALPLLQHQQRKRGFQAFSVMDDVSKPVAKAQPKKIDVKTRSVKNVDAFWNKYFSKNQPPQSAVRSKVRRLMSQKKYDHVIAVIRGALRNGQAQPWMYEAMALAMQIDKQSPEEVERALMSAVDWATSPLDVMYVAAYLNDLGLNERSLQLFRQVSESLPDQPEPYMHGLRVAQKLKDIEGIKWATVGILSRAWPKDQAKVWVKGMRVAKATLEQLKQDGRAEEATEYEKALNKALVRDVVIRLRWSGDADIDLMVEEPSGTICSCRNARTVAGGIMMGDKYAVDREDGEEEFSEAYVCPRAFSGKYKLMIRRVWGEVTAGKVTVDVYYNWNTKAAKHMQKRITLAENGAEGTFELAHGRRKELLREQQVAAAAAGQLAVRQQVLAQQVAAVVDTRASESLADSRQGADGVNAGIPRVRQNAVGYQPIITTLPEGMWLYPITAVVSADRRYVRITASPNFSSIPAVNTFNFVSGEGGSTGGGGMGGYGGGMGGGMGGMGGGMGMM